MHSFYSFCLSAPRSGEGKTILSIGLMRLFARRGLCVQGFKCGPDYIDPSFHAEATGQSACNIDTWMMGEQGVQNLWHHRTKNADMGICEGVMGLFDGREIGSLVGSTADVARVLNLPVILVFNARGMAGSVLALALGFYEYARQHGVTIRGFIANNVGSSRHIEILQEAFQSSNLPPLLGAVPRNALWTLPERQLGLVPSQEIASKTTGEKSMTAWYDSLAEELEKYIDVDKILEVSLCSRLQIKDISALSPQDNSPSSPYAIKAQKRMAIAKDNAFCFYYEENERELIRQGYTLIEFSPLFDKELPKDIDALYLGGGYPEVFAKELSENSSMRESIKNFAENNGEIYAECGGYMYLCKSIETTEPTAQNFPMCGVLNATAFMGAKIRSLGYREVELLSSAPFSLRGLEFRGHEFHWSSISHHQDYSPLYLVKNKKSIEEQGVHYKNVKAGYIHLYWGAGHFKKDKDNK